MRHLLITAINQYDRDFFGGDIDLSGCLEDARRIRQHLAREDDRVVEIVNKQAKKAVVIAAIDTLCRIAAPGDTVIWYHSGHGTYYDGPNGRHTLRVMHDGYLTDTDVAHLLSGFKAGITVVTISDTCHAEGNSRTAAVPPYPGARRRTIPPPKERVANIVKEATAKVKYAATIYHISACKLDEVAWETADGGVFTSVFSRALHAYTKPTSVTTIFKAAAANIACQSPAIKAINAGKSKPPKL